MRKQRVGLEHHRDVPLRGWQAGHVAATDEYAPLIGGLEARDQAQRGRFAAARGPEEHVERALVERKGEAVDRADLALWSRPVLADVLGGDCGHKATLADARSRRACRTPNERSTTERARLPSAFDSSARTGTDASCASRQPDRKS